MPSTAWLDVTHETIGETPDAAFQWLTDNFDSFRKPYATVGTNDTSERLEMPKAKITLRGTPEKQAAYTRTLLALAAMPEASTPSGATSL